LKTLLPILENASLEDDEDLHDRWANLLANAANPALDHTKRNLHVSILKELSAAEVHFLDTAYDYVVERISQRDQWGPGQGLGWEIKMQYILDHSMQQERFDLSDIDNLERLNLLRRSTSHDSYLERER
jgi:Abortive infection alpha